MDEGRQYTTLDTMGRTKCSLPPISTLLSIADARPPTEHGSVPTYHPPQEKLPSNPNCQTSSASTFSAHDYGNQAPIETTLPRRRNASLLSIFTFRGRGSASPTPAFAPVGPCFQCFRLSEGYSTRSSSLKNAICNDDLLLQAIGMSHSLNNVHPSSSCIRQATYGMITPHITYGRSRYVCHTCNKSFSRPSGLQIHSTSHTGEKPFQCTHAGCGKYFSVRSNRRRHERLCHPT